MFWKFSILTEAEGNIQFHIVWWPTAHTTARPPNFVVILSKIVACFHIGNSKYLTSARSAPASASALVAITLLWLLTRA